MIVDEPMIALVPIKARKQCKTRLSQHLTGDQRVELVRSMLIHVLAVLGSVPYIEQVFVLSPERDEVPGHIEVLQDDGRDLNKSLSDALSTLHRRGYKQVAIVPADLARLSIGDLDAVASASTPGAITLAPSTDEQGTNLLCLPTGLPFTFMFGDDSFYLHQKEAMNLGVAVNVVVTSGLGFDLDTPADYNACVSAVSHTHVSAVRGVLA